MGLFHPTAAASGPLDKRWLIRLRAATRFRCHTLVWAEGCAKYARYADATYAGDIDANSLRWAEIAIENYDKAITALCTVLRSRCGYASTRRVVGAVASIAAARATVVREEVKAKTNKYVYVGTCDVRAPQNLHCTGSTRWVKGPGKVPLTLQCTSNEYEYTSNTLQCTCPHTLQCTSPHTLQCTCAETPQCTCAETPQCTCAETPQCTCAETPQCTCAETPQCTCAETPQCTCAETPQCTCAETLQCTPETLQCTCRSGEGIATLMPPKPARTQCMGVLAATPSAVACAVACQPAAYVAADQGCWSGHGC